MDSILQNKLYHFEANPPEEVWDKIADSLDTEENTFPQRLINYEVLPPAKSWTVIEASLDQVTTPVKVIPLTRYKKPLRYIAAASIIAAILAITRLSSRQDIDGTTQATTEIIAPLNQSSLLPVPKKQVLVEEDIPAPPAPVTTIASTKRPGKAARKAFAAKRVLEFIQLQNAITNVSFSGQFIPKTVNKEELFDFTLLDDYMVYSDGNGNAMKLPKKLFSLVNCKDGDGSCKERIYQLRQKLSVNTVPTDFASLLEIVRQMQ